MNCKLDEKFCALRNEFERPLHCFTNSHFAKKKTKQQQNDKRNNDQDWKSFKKRYFMPQESQQTTKAIHSTQLQNYLKTIYSHLF